jgi:hypothetical protein
VELKARIGLAEAKAGTAAAEERSKSPGELLREVEEDDRRMRE